MRALAFISCLLLIAAIIFPLVGWLVVKLLIFLRLPDPHAGYFGYAFVGAMLGLLGGGIHIKFGK